MACLIRNGKPLIKMPANCRLGFSLLECSVSVILVSILMVASLNTLAAAKRREIDTVQRISGQQLACDLMNEILLQDYDEPNTEVASAFGLEPGESGVNRSLYDDVDDYAGFSSSPPKDRGGNTIAGFNGWTRSVIVQWADPTTGGSTPATSTGLKKITITASFGNKSIATIVGYRSISWNDSVPSPADATGNHPPVAVAVVTSNGGLNRGVGQNMTFDATTSSDPDGDTLSYVWNFGDGTTGTGKTVVHAYSAARNYTCTLTVYDGNGGMATASLTPVISP